MKDLMKKLKKLNTSCYINNHTPNYINKWVFRFAFLLICSQLVYIMYLEDFDFSQHAFIECKSESKCLNTFYQCQNQSVIYQNFMIIDCRPYNKVGCVDGVCSKEFIEPNNIIGNKPSEEFKDFPFDVFVFVMVAFILNHIIYLLWGEKKNDIKNNFKE